ncbi:hypothetical protein ACWIUD_00400 [Helicobacter sp. 23-1044]
MIWIASGFFKSPRNDEVSADSAFFAFFHTRFCVFRARFCVFYIFFTLDSAIFVPRFCVFLQIAESNQFRRI